MGILKPLFNRRKYRPASSKLDQLYLLGSGSTHDDMELRYSLRSLEKYCKNYGRIFVVGRKPDWLTNVEFLPCEDCYDAAHKNMMNKITYACKETDISEDFVMQADDHFYVRPYDFSDIRLYDKGVIRKDIQEGHAGNPYHASMSDTRFFLRHIGYPYMNSSQHCGMWYKRSLWLSMEDTILREAFDYPYGLENSSLMANAMHQQLHIPFTYRKDCKIADFNGEQDLLNKIDGNFCFSIYDSAFQHAILPILNRWFPTPSKYEQLY